MVRQAAVLPNSLFHQHHNRFWSNTSEENLNQNCILFSGSFADILSLCVKFKLQQKWETFHFLKANLQSSSDFLTVVEVSHWFLAKISRLPELSVEQQNHWFDELHWHQMNSQPKSQLLGNQEVELGVTSLKNFLWKWKSYYEIMTSHCLYTN